VRNGFVKIFSAKLRILIMEKLLRLDGALRGGQTDCYAEGCALFAGQSYIGRNY
jgi:hypothetical protein